MAKLIFRMLALLAVLASPLGMTPAPAHAATSHAAMSEMPADHCPDTKDQTGDRDVVPECAMACSAALPASELAPVERLPAAPAMAVSRLEQSLRGIHPDIATPPPKRS